MTEPNITDNPENMTRIMVDIETLGLDIGSAILSIGAVEFDENGTYDSFYKEISLQSNQEHGLEFDADTLEWWLQQEESAQEVLVGGDDLKKVLKDFNKWLTEAKVHRPGTPIEIWANSPSFDCEHLEYAMQQVGIDPHWEYYQERDVRTIRSLPCAVECDVEGTEHNALDDAKQQAKIVGETLQRIQGGCE